MNNEIRATQSMEIRNSPNCSTHNVAYTEQGRRWGCSKTILQLRLLSICDVEYLAVAPGGYPLQLDGGPLSNVLLSLLLTLTGEQHTADQSTHSLTQGEGSTKVLAALALVRA